MNFETLCLHAGYTPKNGEPRALPIVQSTTYTYDSAESIGKLFDLEEAGFFYTRLANPTTSAVEEKIAALEGGVAAMCTASGQSAVFYALMNLLESGDHFISASSIYGGSYNLFAHTFRKMGIEVTFVDQFAPIEELKKVSLLIEKQTLALINVFEKPALLNPDENAYLETQIRTITAEMERTHTERMAQGKCSVDAGMIFLEFSAQAIAISRHISNIYNRVKRIL